MNNNNIRHYPPIPGPKKPRKFPVWGWVVIAAAVMVVVLGIAFSGDSVDKNSWDYHNGYRRGTHLVLDWPGNPTYGTIDAVCSAPEQWGGWTKERLHNYNVGCHDGVHDATEAVKNRPY